VQEIIAKRIIDIAALGTVVRAMSCKRCSPLVLLDAAPARNGHWVRLFGSDLSPFYRMQGIDLCNMVDAQTDQVPR